MRLDLVPEPQRVTGGVHSLKGGPIVPRDPVGESRSLEQELLRLSPVVDDLQHTFLVCPVPSPGPCTHSQVVFAGL